MHDPDAGFTRKNDKSFFGYKAHAAVDRGSGLILQIITTTASIHDRRACPRQPGLQRADPARRGSGPRGQGL
jgi:IS5 family transposase